MALKLDWLATLSPQARTRALETLERRAAGDAEALGELRAAAEAFQTSFDDAAARCPFHAQPEVAGAPLSPSALTPLVGVPAVFQLRLYTGDTQLLAGTLKSVGKPAAGRVTLTFEAYHPREAQKLLGPSTRLHVPGDLTLTVTPDPTQNHLQAAVPLSTIEGLSERGPSQAPPRAKLGEAARRAREQGRHEPRVNAAGELRRVRVGRAVKGEDYVVARGEADRAALAHAQAAFQDDLKWDQNVLAAPLIEHAVSVALGRLDGAAEKLVVKRTGLARARAKSLTEKLGRAFLDTLHDALDELFAGPPEELGTLKRQLDDAVALRTGVGDAGWLIKRGAGTFAYVAASVASALPKLFEAQVGRPGEPAELAAVFRNSFKLFRDLAASDVDVLGKVLRREFALFDKGMGPVLQLTGDGADRRVELRPEVRERIERRVGAGLEARLPGTTGCPALVTFDGQNPLDRLLTRFGALLEETYAMDAAKVRRASG